MRGRLGRHDAPYPARQRLAAALRTVQQVDAASVAEQALARGLKGPAVGDAVRAARVQALAAAAA
jgi:tRNA nucleotidyltransferase (CCA-adding enzyme)